MCTLQSKESTLQCTNKKITLPSFDEFVFDYFCGAKDQTIVSSKWGKCPTTEAPSQPPS